MKKYAFLLKKVLYKWDFLVYNNLVRQSATNHHIMKNTPALAARKNLIAQIAQRHAAEAEFVKSVAVKESTDTESEYQSVITEEFDRLQKASINTAGF
jgi:hypothetical protein